MNETYKNLLQTDAAINDLGRYLVRSGASVEETAVAMLELTGKFYQALGEIAFTGYEIEAADEERI
jgi:hypothetical protein